MFRSCQATPWQSCLLKDDDIVASVRCWVESFVVELNLCPFAKHELSNDRVRFAVSNANTAEQLTSALRSELELLGHDSSVETTLLVHPKVLLDFHSYNQYLSCVDRLLDHLQLDGVFQVASFHPDYQFEGTVPEDAENYTNRSPHPMLHIIREESIHQAISGYPNVDKVPAQNIKLMNQIGPDKLQALLRSCIDN